MTSCSTLLLLSASNSSRAVDLLCQLDMLKLFYGITSNVDGRVARLCMNLFVMKKQLFGSRGITYFLAWMDLKHNRTKSNYHDICYLSKQLVVPLFVLSLNTHYRCNCYS